MRRIFAGMLAIVAVGFAGCGGDSGMDAGGIDSGGTDAGGMDAGSTDAGGTDAGPPDAGPSGPTISATCTGPVGGDVTATITVTGFVLEAPGGQPAIDGHGHIHAYLDDATGGAYLAIISTTASPAVIGLPSGTTGPHRLEFQLVGNDHMPLVPEIRTPDTMCAFTAP